MENQIKVSSNDQEGSIIANGSANPNNIGGNKGGETNKVLPDVTKEYENLQSKLGEQGRELGEYRQFFEGVAPLLDKLDKSPELVRAIIDGKVDEELAKAALQDKITIGDAKVITQAHTEVKKELGKDYSKTSNEDISKLVEERVGQVKKEMEMSLKEVEDARSFEQSVNEFINNTPDFPKYAEEIENWLTKHGDVTDIEVAYYAVKGQLSEREAARVAENDKAEHAKNIALNAGGGRGGQIIFPEGMDPADVLISSRSNPNIFK